MNYYKVTKKDGQSLYSHGGKCVQYRAGMTIAEPKWCNDATLECGRGIYCVTEDQLPLWWHEYETAVWLVKPIGRDIVPVGKGYRCRKMKIVRKLRKREIIRLVPGWFERVQAVIVSNATQTAGNRSTQTAGDASTQTAGNASTQKAGNDSTQTAGNDSTQTAWGYSTQTAGDASTQTAGNRSTQTAGDASTQTAGNDSTQTAGDASTQKAGNRSTQKAGNDSTQKAGLKSVQVGYWVENGEYKTACRVVTENEADKPYKFERGVWTLVDEIERASHE